MRDFRSCGEPHGSRAARLIEIEALIGGAGTADMLFGKKAVRAAADNLSDGLERGLACDPFGHYGWDVRARSGQRLGQMRERTL
jgi:hypothetical protein